MHGCRTVGCTNAVLTASKFHRQRPSLLRHMPENNTPAYCTAAERWAAPTQSSQHTSSIDSVLLSYDTCLRITRQHNARLQNGGLHQCSPHNIQVLWTPSFSLGTLLPLVHLFNLLMYYPYVLPHFNCIPLSPVPCAFL